MNAFQQAAGGAGATANYTIINLVNSTAINITNYNTPTCTGTSAGSITAANVFGPSSTNFGASGGAGFPTISLQPSLPSSWPAAGVLLSQFSQPGCSGTLQAYAYYAFTSACSLFGPLSDVRYTSCSPGGNYTALLYASDDGSCSNYWGPISQPLNAYSGAAGAVGQGPVSSVPSWQQRPTSGGTTVPFGTWDIGYTSGYDCITCASGPPAPAPGPVAAPAVTLTAATFAASCPATSSSSSLSCLSGAQYTIPAAGVCISGSCGSASNLNYVSPGPLFCNAGNLTANFPSVCASASAITSAGSYLDAATWTNVVAGASSLGMVGTAAANVVTATQLTTGSFQYCAGIGFTCSIAAMASGLCDQASPVGSFIIRMAGLTTSITGPAPCNNINGLLAAQGNPALISRALLCSSAGCNTASAIAAAGWSAPAQAAASSSAPTAASLLRQRSLVLVSVSLAASFLLLV